MKGVKSVFEELDSSEKTDRLLLEYDSAVEKYYANIIEELGYSMTFFPIRNIISRKIAVSESGIMSRFADVISR